MRLMDVKRLAASYGLAIDTSTLGSLLYVELFYWKLVWVQMVAGICCRRQKHSLLWARLCQINFRLQKKQMNLTQKAALRLLINRIVNFVRNSTHYISTLKIRNLDELKKFFDDFYAKWAERRKIHKIQEISSIADKYTV